MEYTNTTLRQILADYNDDKFDKSNIIDLWFDWFCSNGALLGRADKILYMLSKLSADAANLLDNYTISFCNHCPAAGPLYDSVAFAYIPNANYSSELDFVICIDDKRENYRYMLYGFEEYDNALFATNSRAEMIEFLNTLTANRIETISTFVQMMSDDELAELPYTTKSQLNKKLASIFGKASVEL